MNYEENYKEAKKKVDEIERKQGILAVIMLVWAVLWTIVLIVAVVWTSITSFGSLANIFALVVLHNTIVSVITAKIDDTINAKKEFRYLNLKLAETLRNSCDKESEEVQ